MKAESSLSPMWRDLVTIAPGRWKVVERDLLVNQADTLETRLEGITEDRIAAAEVQLKDVAEFDKLGAHYDKLFPDERVCPVRTTIGNKDLPEDVFAKVYLLVAPEYCEIQHINAHSEGADRLALLGLKGFGRYSFRTNINNQSPYVFFVSAQTSDDANMTGNICHNFTKTEAIARMAPHPGQYPRALQVTVHKRRDADNKLIDLVKAYYLYAKVRVIDVDSLPLDVKDCFITVCGRYVLG